MAQETQTRRNPDEGCVVVIGAGAMGVAVARRLGRLHDLLVVDIDRERAEAAAEALRGEGITAVPVCGDATSPESVEQIASEVRRRGGLRVLAYVAGLSPSAADFTDIMRVNLRGPALTTQALLPLAHRGAVAILIASLAAHTSTPELEVRRILSDPEHPEMVERLRAELSDAELTSQSAYRMSKYGLVAWCRRQALAWGDRGARIVSMSPGLIDTPMGSLEDERNPIRRERAAAIPLERQGTMTEVVDAVEFLASPRASYISGIDLLVDGGLAGRLATESFDDSLAHGAPTD